MPSCERYDPLSDEWEMIASMPKNLVAYASYPAAAALDGRIYVVGGAKTRETFPASAQVFQYDPTENSWQSVAPMLKPRTAPAAAALGGFLYVVGGSEEPFKAHRSAERYDPSTNRWEAIADIPEALAGSALVTIE